jgi:hypothetical protein
MIRAGTLSLTVACMVPLVGCMATGVHRVEVLSFHGDLAPPRAAALPLVAGIRIGTVNGEVNSANEQYMINNFAARLSAANLFRQITHPTSGRENIMLEIGGKTMVHRPRSGPLLIGNALLCGFTLMLLCLPLTSTYEFTVDVRALTWPASEEINRYGATGASRVTYGAMTPEAPHTEGWRAAVTSTFDQIINQMAADEAKYLLKAPP